MASENTLNGQRFEEGFRSIVSNNFNAVAVEDSYHSITYEELDERSKQLACELDSLGTQKIVAVCCSRSCDWVATVLAIWRSGNIYLPIDASLPSKRVEEICKRSQASLLLLDSGTSKLQALELDTLRLDSVEKHESIEFTDRFAQGQQPINLIYTSGSTGRPKGVLLPKVGLDNLAAAQKQIFKCSNNDRVLQFASISFDASVWEMLMALSSGSTLCIAEGDNKLPSLGLAEFLKERSITIATLPPVVMNMLPLGQHPKLKQLILAGEASSQELMESWSNYVRIYNAYGPTETTVCASVACFQRGMKATNLGRPILNSRLHVLDEKGKKIKSGKGELYIESPGLAIGYHLDEELSREFFVSLPEISSSLLYKSGDFVELKDKETIHYLGRNDDQVKIRGHRIGSLEVESYLRRAAKTETVAVVVEADQTQQKFLHAFVLSSKPEQSKKEIMKELATIAPSYMLPTKLTIVSQMPTTINGKIDKAALLAGKHTLPLETPQASPQAHTKELQDKLCKIFATVLSQPSFAPDDDFFLEGGHSLQMTRTIARIWEEEGIRISAREFHANSTPESLLQLINEKKQEAVKTQQGTSFAQKAVYFAEKRNPSSLAYQAQAVIELIGQVDTQKLRRAILQVCQRHEIFRSGFEYKNGELVANVSNDVDFDIAIHDLSHLPEHTSDQDFSILCEQMLKRKISMGDAPLASWCIVKVKTHLTKLIHVEHHLIHDGWSFRNFLKELLSLYAGENIESPTQFSVFVEEEKKFFAEVTKSKDFLQWAEKLKEKIHSKPLLEEKSRPKTSNGMGCSLKHQLPLKLGKKIIEEARKNNVSPFSYMMTLFAKLVSSRAKAKNFVLGTSMANRISVADESIIGMMVNTLPIAFQISEDKDVWTLMKDTQAALLEAHDFQRMPFGNLVTQLNPKRSPNMNPLYQIAFNFHNAPVGLPRLPDLQVNVQEALSNSSAKMDLNVVVINGATQAGSYLLNWEFNTALFSEEYMQDLLLEYVELLELSVLRTKEDSNSDLFRSLSEIWRSKLSVEEVCPKANFFDLGGHSLLALEVIDELKSQTGLDLELDAFFMSPVLEEQVFLLSQNKQRNRAEHHA